MTQIAHILAESLGESWHLFLDSAIYVLFGIIIGGLFKVFLSPSYVARHLGEGRFSSVLKAAFLGIPIPLCSCGVLPAAASLKKQGANNGATAAFLISTPESGVDSISISYALLDPVLTVARPVAAFVSALTAGIAENLFNPPRRNEGAEVDLSCQVDNCCTGNDCSPEEHASHHTTSEKIKAGLGYAVNDLWGDLAGWFAVGMLLAGLISALVPEDAVTTYLGGGIRSMVLMLLVGIPLYICATASTPIAAAMILKGVSPGAALVFLLVGPATNMASLSVLLGILGKRATVFYLLSIATVSIVCGLLLDAIYGGFGITAKATIGQAAEIFPLWLQLPAALILLVISLPPLYRWLKKRAGGSGPSSTAGSGDEEHCGCSTGSCSTE